jgi:methyl-accepting chemotaxis protein
MALVMPYNSRVEATPLVNESRQSASRTRGGFIPPARSARREANSRPSGRRHLLLDLPIAWRLSLGFLAAALIAAAAAGLTGIQRAESSGREANFYQSLLSANTSLTTADSFLQLLNTEVHTALTDAAAIPISKETVSTDQSAIAGLTERYADTLGSYTANDLLKSHPDETALLAEAGAQGESAQQGTLVASALRTWQVYRTAQTQVVADIAAGNLPGAEALERAQGEPTNADAQSALRALIQFDGHIASSVQAAAQVEQQNQLITTLVAAVIAFLCIALVGWLISDTLVRRLNKLRYVTQSVEQGDVGQRVSVVGRDEVADVSASVNGMLDTIVGLLEVTRRQRDALTNAAERLFTDVRLAGTGDLRVKAAVGGDPIGMLANAFNFTIGRFRRLVLRTQTSVEQLDVLARQQMERAEAFYTASQQYALSRGGSGRIREHASQLSGLSTISDLPDTRRQVYHGRELVRRIAREGAGGHSKELHDYAEQSYLSAGRISQLAMSAMTALEQRSAGTIEQALYAQLAELRTLGALLAQIGVAAQAIQQSSTRQLSDLDATLESILTLAAESSPGPSMVSPSTAVPPSVSASLPPAELARVAEGFARDVAQMARQISILTQELRTGVLPFRLDPGGDDGGDLYAPGTGYGEMPSAYGSRSMP